MQFFEFFLTPVFGLSQPETAIPKREIRLFAERRGPTAHGDGNRSMWKIAFNTAV